MKKTRLITTVRNVKKKYTAMSEVVSLSQVRHGMIYTAQVTLAPAQQPESHGLHHTGTPHRWR